MRNTVTVTPKAMSIITKATHQRMRKRASEDCIGPPCKPQDILMLERQ